MSKLLICADELGEMIFNKKGRSDLRCWLTRARGEYKKECCPPVYIDDHANFTANSNEILSAHTESEGAHSQVLVKPLVWGLLRG